MEALNLIQILEANGLDYLLVNSTNKYLVEYPELSENARYTLTGFTGSTGDALVTRDNIFLYVDGRYHIQAENEVKDCVTIVKLQLGQNQDEEIRRYISEDSIENKIIGIVANKVSQQRLEGFKKFNVKLLDTDPINNYTEEHNTKPEIAFTNVKYEPEATFIANLEEASYLTGLRDFSKNNSAKIWSKLFINGENRILFNDDKECEEFLKGFSDRIFVDKNNINAHDFALIRKPIHRLSEVRRMKAIKSTEEIITYKNAFKRTDMAVRAIREYIEANQNLSEYDISEKLKEKFFEYGAKSLSFNPIVAINKNSAQAHYSKASKDTTLNEGDIVLIDCGAYYESGLATDITRVFVKGNPSSLQKEVYTSVLKAFLNCYNYKAPYIKGIDIDSLAHSMLDNKIPGFRFNHGLGHGIGINVHEAPPNLSQNEIAKSEITDGMCFTIEPGLYHPDYFGVRLENSCYMLNGEICSFVNMGYEGKLINYEALTPVEKKQLEEFEIL